MKKANLNSWNGKAVLFNKHYIDNHPAQQKHNNFLKCIGISFVDKADRLNILNKNYINVIFYDKDTESIEHYRFKIKDLKRTKKAVPLKLKEKTIEIVNNYHHGRFTFVDNLGYVEFMKNVEKVKII